MMVSDYIILLRKKIKFLANIYHSKGLNVIMSENTSTTMCANQIGFDGKLDKFGIHNNGSNIQIK